jgi:GMP synthase-like glutamine amidotransferase
MRIAVLVTNTDESAFAQRHPKDGDKFAMLLHGQRPTWDVVAYAVKDGVFPPHDARFDGWIVTGSPASVHDDAPWVRQLLALIRQLDDQKARIFGACFGHQAIALALGGAVEDNPAGWVFGATDTVMESHPIRLYAAHREQVLQLPPRATSLGGNADCPIGSFAIGNHVLTTQYHPEMTPQFIAALTEELSAKLPADVVHAARQSLGKVAETARIARRIVDFFEAP